MTLQAKTVPVTPIRGVDNRAHEAKVAAGFVREAVNIDIGTEGSFARRPGYTKQVDAAGANSLWSCREIGFGLYVAGGTLYAMWSADYVVPLADVSAGDMHYAFMAGRVYYSNGTDKGCVTPQGEYMDWGVERPSATFAVAPADTGALYAGRYQVTLTYMTASREESGAPESFFVDVPEGGGIALSAIPQPLSPEVLAVRVYMSQPNGEQCFYARDIPVGMTDVILGQFQRGKPLDTQFLAPIPAGKYLLAYKGRIFIAQGKYLFFTDSLRYGQYHETKGYIKFGEEITGVAAPEGAGANIYVGTKTKTYALRGGTIDDISVSVAVHEGIVPGSVITVPGELFGVQGLTTPVPVWLSTNGQFKMGSIQDVVPIRDRNLATDIPGKAASLFFDRDGNKMAMFSFFGGKTNALAVRDRAAARVYNNTGVPG